MHVYEYYKQISRRRHQYGDLRAMSSIPLTPLDHTGEIPAFKAGVDAIAASGIGNDFDDDDRRNSGERGGNGRNTPHQLPPLATKRHGAGHDREEPGSKVSGEEGDDVSGAAEGEDQVSVHGHEGRVLYHVQRAFVARSSGRMNEYAIFLTSSVGIPFCTRVEICLTWLWLLGVSDVKLQHFWCRETKTWRLSKTYSRTGLRLPAPIVLSRLPQVILKNEVDVLVSGWKCEHYFQEFNCALYRFLF